MKRISHINSAKIMASLHNLRFRLAIGVFSVYVMCWVAGARQSNLCSCLSSVRYVCKERYFYVLFWVGVSSENLFILAGHIQKILLLYSLQWGFEYIREVSKQTENNKLRTLISYTRWDDIQARPSGGRVWVCCTTEKFAQTYTIESLEAYTWAHGNIRRAHIWVEMQDLINICHATLLIFHMVYI